MPRPIQLHVSPHGATADEAAAVQAALEAAMDTLEVAPDFELGLVLTTDAALQTLNFEFRGLDKPTDVLSFAFDPADLPPGEPPYLGDIVISVPYAERNAAGVRQDIVSSTAIAGPETSADGAITTATSLPADAWTRLDELKLLAVHGLLHLLGHDDETDEGAEIMRAQERRLGVRRA